MTTEKSHPSSGPKALRQPVRILAVALSVLAIFFLLGIVADENYLLFHVLAEGFSIVIAYAVFILAFNARVTLDNDYLLFLGIAYFFIGTFDLVHTLSYSGMDLIEGGTTNTATQLWLSARYLESLSLLVAPIFLRKKLPLAGIIIMYSFITAGVITSIYSGVFPTAYIDGRGLTTFKVASEFVISAILAAAAGYLYFRRDRIDKEVFSLAQAAIIVTIASEICFSLYLTPYGLLNIFGHFLKIISFYLIYRALIVVGLRRPYDLLHRELSRRHDLLQDLVDQRTASLKESERRFRMIAETIDDVFWMSTPGIKQMVYVSPAYEKVWGACRDYLYQNPQAFIESIHPDDRQKIIDGLGDHAEGKWNFEYRIQRKDGSMRWIKDRGFPVYSEDNRLEAMVGIATDVTEMVNVLEALRLNEERLQMALKTSGVAVSQTDRELRYTWVYSPVSDFDPETLIGKCDDEIISNPEIDRFIAFKQKVLDTVHPAEDEFNFPMADGEHTFYVLAQPLKNKDGEVVGVTTAGTDITERRELELQLRQAQKMDAIGRLAGGIAHDFNNMMQIVNGYSRTSLSLVDKNDPLYDNLESILKAGESAAELTKKLLAFSRRQVLRPEVTNLNDVVNSIHRMIGRTLGEDVECTLNLSEDLGKVKVDAGQVEQVLINLAINSRDAMPGGGKLTIETANQYLDRVMYDGDIKIDPGAYVTLSVSDTGCGIEKDILDNIFDPFFTTKPVGQGTGLGLSTVYGIVSQSGGAISVYSEPGVGTTFKIYFPTTDEQPQTHQETTPATEISGNETILVVEDEPGVRQFIIEQLSALGYNVLDADNYKDALELADAHSQQIDILITDVVLPDSGGRQIAKAIKMRQPDIPVIFISGFSENNLINRDLVDESINFLEKPFTIEQLGHKIRLALASANASATTLESADSTGVLIIDDQQEIAELLAEIVEAEGYKVSLAFSGEHALEVFKNDKPSKIILDLNLPDIDGYQLARQFLEVSPSQKSDIIILSGYDPIPDDDRDRQLNIRHHLIKPIDTDYLLKLLSE